ncbi:MAG: hypothetical protein QOE63_790, partial [Acidimicrobiaceae bacterium]
HIALPGHCERAGRSSRHCSSHPAAPAAARRAFRSIARQDDSGSRSQPRPAGSPNGGRGLENGRVSAEDPPLRRPSQARRRLTRRGAPRLVQQATVIEPSAIRAIGHDLRACAPPGIRTQNLRRRRAPLPTSTVVQELSEIKRFASIDVHSRPLTSVVRRPLRRPRSGCLRVHRCLRTSTVARSPNTRVKMSAAEAVVHR